VWCFFYLQQYHSTSKAGSHGPCHPLPAALTKCLWLVMWKPNFFHKRLSVWRNRCFTDNRNFVIIWNYRRMPHRPCLRSPMLTLCDELHYTFFVITLKDDLQPTRKRVKGRYRAVITANCTIFTDLFYSSQNKQSWLPAGSIEYINSATARNHYTVK